MIQAILAVLSAYLIAALPTAYILAKLQGKNIFELGSGNMGAMNTFRNLGITAGIAVLIIDIAKGYLAVKLAQIIATNNINIGYFAAIAVVLGHAWSIYVGFRGGKALSSSFGTLLALDPKGALVVLFAIIIFSLAIKKKPNFAAVIAMLSYPILVLSLYFIKQESSYLKLFMATVIMFAIILYKHLPGLKREFGESLN